MKLLSLTNRYYFISIILIVIIGGFATYQILKTSINIQFNKKLSAEKEQLILELHSYDDLKNLYYLNIGDKITLETIALNLVIPDTTIDTLLFDEFQNKYLTFRQLQFSEFVDGNNYLVTISKSLLSTDELINNIEQVMFVMMFAIIVSLILISNRISRTVWKPFYNSVLFLRNYDITNPKRPQFYYTKIEEFNELNEVISQMIQKSIHDYETLKEFNENASHEIQTPLAIIKAKAELMLQDDTLNQEQVQGINTIYSAASRLSHLNSDLLFLTKMDNNEFPQVKKIYLKEFLQMKLDQFEDLIRLKALTLIKEFKAEPVILINESLCFMMISNLVNNAIRHNVENGRISIKLSNNSLEIENTGKPLRENPETLFNRFKKDSDSFESSGLGLSLVKKICDIYDYEISYVNIDTIHRITVLF